MDDVNCCLESVEKIKEISRKMSTGEDFGRDNLEMNRLYRCFNVKSPQNKTPSCGEIQSMLDEFVDPRDAPRGGSGGGKKARGKIMQELYAQIRKLTNANQQNEKIIFDLKNKVNDLNKKNRNIMSELTRKMKENQKLKLSVGLYKNVGKSPLKRSQSVRSPNAKLFMKTQIKGEAEENEELDKDVKDLGVFLKMTGFERKFALKYIKPHEVRFISEVFKSADGLARDGKVVKKVMSLMKKMKKRKDKKAAKAAKKELEGNVDGHNYRRSQSLYHRKRPQSAMNSVAYRITAESSEKSLLPGLERRNSVKHLNRKLSFRNPGKKGSLIRKIPSKDNMVEVL